MRSRMMTGAASVLVLMVTMGVGEALAHHDGPNPHLNELAVEWSDAYPDRTVYQCAQATGTGNTPDPSFVAPHGFGAIVLYGISGTYEVYENVQTGDRLFAPNQEGIRYVVRIRWVGVGGYYHVCHDQPTTTTVAPPTTVVVPPTTVLGSTTTSEAAETTTTVAATTTIAETTTTAPGESSTTAAPGESTSTSVAAATTVTEMPTTTTAVATTVAETSTTESETSTTDAQPSTTGESTTSIVDQTSTSTGVAPTTTVPIVEVEELPFTGIDLFSMALAGIILFGGGLAVVLRTHREGPAGEPAA